MPDNGTAYLQAALTDSLKFRFLNDSLFGVYSVELAGYSSVVPEVTAYFFGYRSDGSIVSTNFLGSGFTFHTFYFGPEFNSLTRVEVPAWGSLDNLVVTVPEPGTWAVLLLGGGLAGWRFFSRKGK